MPEVNFFRFFYNLHRGLKGQCHENSIAFYLMRYCLCSMHHKLVFQSSIKNATIYFIVVLSMLFAVLSDIAPPRMPISIDSLLSVGHQNVMRDKGRSGQSVNRFYTFKNFNLFFLTMVGNNVKSGCIF